MCEYYREGKQDFERLLIFLNIKMSAKSNKIELSEEFMVMWKEEQPLEVFCKKGVFRKTPVPEPFLIKLQASGNFLEHLLLQNTSGRLLPNFDKLQDKF